MRKEKIGTFNFVSLFIILALILVIVVWGLYPRKPEKSYIASDAVKKAMKYHGVQSITTDPEKKEAYFYRDGKKVMVILPPEEYERR